MRDYLLDVIILVLIYFLFLFRSWKRKENFALRTFWYLYICAVLSVTLMPFAIPVFKGNNQYLKTINFIPFIDVIKSHNGAIRELLLNILMLIPYGFLTPLLKKMNLRKTLLKSFLFSFLIEFVQLLYCRAGLLTSRVCDVTDLITNTLGGVIGYGLFCILKRSSKDI